MNVGGTFRRRGAGSTEMKPLVVASSNYLYVAKFLLCSWLILFLSSAGLGKEPLLPFVACSLPPVARSVYEVKSVGLIDHRVQKYEIARFSIDFTRDLFLSGKGLLTPSSPSPLLSPSSPSSLPSSSASSQTRTPSSSTNSTHNANPLNHILHLYCGHDTIFKPVNFSLQAPHAALEHDHDDIEVMLFAGQLVVLPQPKPEEEQLWMGKGRNTRSRPLVNLLSRMDYVAKRDEKEQQPRQNNQLGPSQGTFNLVAYFLASHTENGKHSVVLPLDALPSCRVVVRASEHFPVYFLPAADSAQKDTAVPVVNPLSPPEELLVDGAVGIHPIEAQAFVLDTAAIPTKEAAASSSHSDSLPSSPTSSTSTSERKQHEQDAAAIEDLFLHAASQAMVVETRQIARAMKLRRHEEEHREAVQRHAFRDRQTARRQRQQRQTAKERAKGKKGSTALSSPVFLQTEESIVKVDTTTAAAAATVTAATAAASSFSTSEGESGRVDLLNSLGSAIPEPTETVEEKRAERIDDSIAQAKVRLNEKYARQVAAFASKRQYYERLNTMQRKDDALNLIKFRKAEIARRKALFEESEGKLADLVDLDVHRIANGHGMKDASKIFLETNANVQSLLEMHLEAQFEDGFTHVAQAAADAEASLKTEGRSQLRSGSKALTSARVMQMLAAIVDPIMAQVPPEMMKLGINAIEQPVIGVLKDVMSDMLLEYFIPKATKKLLEMPWKDIPDTDIELLGSGKVEVAESEPVNQETRYAIDMSTKSDFASQLINAVLSNYLPQTIETMHQVLDKEVYETAHRVVPKAAAREITYNLVKLVSDMMIKKIFHLVTHSMTMRATPLLTKIISQTLINSVSLTLTRALTRAPVGDFFCQLCRAKEQEEPNLSEFCDACWSSETAGYYADYYTAYYAHYYTHYYNWYYGGYYSHLTAQDGVQKIAIPESEDPREAEAVPKQEVE